MKVLLRKDHAYREQEWYRRPVLRCIKAGKLFNFRALVYDTAFAFGYLDIFLNGIKCELRDRNDMICFIYLPLYCLKRLAFLTFTLVRFKKKVEVMNGHDSPPGFLAGPHVA